MSDAPPAWAVPAGLPSRARDDAAPGATWRRRWVPPLALFLGSFAWAFVYVSLPFYITTLSRLDEAATLRWSGWILGVSSLVTVATSPLWGRLANRASPRTLWVCVEMLQGSGFFLMALARSLPQLFLARAFLGAMGAASTFAFLIAGRSDAHVRRDVSAIQSSMTVGQLLGPLAGAIAAARLGFRLSFVLGGLVLWATALLVWTMVPPEPPLAPAARPGARLSVGEVGRACLVVLTASTHIFFLTAILPQVLPRLGVPGPQTLEVGGLIIFASGVAATLGALAAPRLAELGGERRPLVWLFVGSSVCLAALGAAPEAWSFGALRFLQVLLVAPVFPLAVAGMAQRASGEAVGLVNSSRIGAAFLGPVLATNLLAWGSSPALVYGALGTAGLGVAAGLARSRFRPGA